MDISLAPGTKSIENTTSSLGGKLLVSFEKTSENVHTTGKLSIEASLSTFRKLAT